MPSPSRNPLSDIPDLLVYPALWRASLGAGPRPWPDQLYLLCSLARGYLRAPGGHAPPAALAPGERLLLRALATVDVDAMIAAIGCEFPGDPNPLTRLDPDPDPRPGPARLALAS